MFHWQTDDGRELNAGCQCWLGSSLSFKGGGVNTCIPKQTYIPVIANKRTRACVCVFVCVCVWGDVRSPITLLSIHINWTQVICLWHYVTC